MWDVVQSCEGMWYFLVCVYVTVGRDMAARQLDMCRNHGQLFSLLDTACCGESASL
jgi:hypothetical protein